MFNRSLHKDPEAVSFQNQNKLLVEWNRKKWKKMDDFEKQDGKLWGNNRNLLFICENLPFWTILLCNKKFVTEKRTLLLYWCPCHCPLITYPNRCMKYPRTSLQMDGTRFWLLQFKGQNSELGPKNLHHLTPTQSIELLMYLRPDVSLIYHCSINLNFKF